MAEYQLPPLKNAEKFEHFVCDLFNCIENTNSYQNTDFQTFGVKGQQQKGIDIISSKTKTVIQCKVKTLTAKEDTIKKKLQEDITQDVKKTDDLSFTFNRIIFASTFRDDAQIQEFANQLKEKEQFSFDIYYWGWDTLTKYAEQHDSILKKYFPKFHTKPSKPNLPDGALGTDLRKKNYASYLIKRYGDWKQIELSKKGEKVDWKRLNGFAAKMYKAVGINYIPIEMFDDMVSYWQDRIDKTAFGRNQKAKNIPNYSSFEEHSTNVQPKK